MYQNHLWKLLYLPIITSVIGAICHRHLQAPRSKGETMAGADWARLWIHQISSENNTRIEAIVEKLWPKNRSSVNAKNLFFFSQFVALFMGFHGLAPNSSQGEKRSETAADEISDVLIVKSHCECHPGHPAEPVGSVLVLSHPWF